MSTTEATTDTDVTTGPTWTLTPSEFAATQERIATINARAAKRGFTGRLAVTGTEREITETNDVGITTTRVVIDTAIEGEAPAYNGWTFLAAVDTVETADGDAFVLRSAPGVEASDVDRDTLVAGRCEHCGSARRNRRYTYLVRNTETGETRQVGSTCIKDFTGWSGKPVFFDLDDLAERVDEFLGGFSSAGDEYTPATVIAIAWAASREFGWVAASSYSGVPTRSKVADYLYGRQKADRELREQLAPHMAGADEKAREIIEALSVGLTGEGGYEANLKVLLRAAHVSSKHLGIVVSAVSAYERMTGAQAQRHAEAAARAELLAKVVYAGTLNEKLTVTGTVTRLVPLESDYGYGATSRMLVIIQGGTTVAKITTAAQWAFSVEQGDEITVIGTVKEHTEYQGVQQTVLKAPKRVMEDTK